MSNVPLHVSISCFVHSFTSAFALNYKETSNRIESVFTTHLVYTPHEENSRQNTTANNGESVFCVGKADGLGDGVAWRGAADVQVGQNRSVMHVRPPTSQVIWVAH